MENPGEACEPMMGTGDPTHKCNICFHAIGKYQATVYHRPCEIFFHLTCFEDGRALCGSKSESMYCRGCDKELVAPLILRINSSVDTDVRAVAVAEWFLNQLANTVQALEVQIQEDAARGMHQRLAAHTAVWRNELASIRASMERFRQALALNYTQVQVQQS